MKETIDSDLCPTMIACKQFNNILKQIQHSGLNFQLQLSPFGAFISLKKSLVKDKKGDFIIPSSSIMSGTLDNNVEDLTALNSKILLLENQIMKLQSDYGCVEDDRAAAYKVIESFASTVKVHENKIKAPENKKEEIKKCTEDVKQKNFESEPAEKEKNTNVIEENSFIHIKPEIVAVEEDLDYNVKVSNSFSPLLQLVQETSSTSEPTLLTSPSSVALSSRQSCSSPQTPLYTQPSPCTLRRSEKQK